MVLTPVNVDNNSSDHHRGQLGTCTTPVLNVFFFSLSLSFFLDAFNDHVDCKENLCFRDRCGNGKRSGLMLTTLKTKIIYMYECSCEALLEMLQTA